LRSPPLPEMAKRGAHSDPEMPARLAPVRQTARLAIRRLPEETMQLLWEVVHLGAANRRLLEDLDWRQTEQRLALVRRPAARPRQQDLRLRRVTQAHFPLLLAHAPQCSKGPGRYAFSREIPVAQKCNRAVRCGGRPIFARYRRPRNRRELADCDSRCSRLRRKRAGPAQPFPIAVEDKRRCRPLPFADRDARFANLG
jgi:hypothetical protein